MKISTADTPEFIGQIIDIFEDFLAKKPGYDKNDVIIVGSDYDTLSAQLTAMMQNWDVLEP